MRGWHLTEFVDWTFMWKYTINMCRNDFDEDTNVMKQKKNLCEIWHASKRNDLFLLGSSRI